MDFLREIAPLGVYVAMGLALLAAFGVILLRNVFHAALALALVLVSIAGIYVSLHAQFLAMIQILVYVGAILTLVVFAIMLTEKFSMAERPLNKTLVFPAALISVSIFAMLSTVVRETPWKTDPEIMSNYVNSVKIGLSLLGPYVFPFEVISIILVVALIGAVIIARRDVES